MLDGKAALVTGAGRGIGRGIALALAHAGAKVVVNDLGTSLSGEGAETLPADQVVDEILTNGGTAVTNRGNVASFDDATQMVEQVVSTFGRIDILVNVAGILRDRMIFNMTEAEWDAVIAVHLKGTFNCTRAASVQMRGQQGGRIISMSSVSALGAPGQPNYAAGKAGILGLTWSTANALGKYGVTANAIMPSGATRMIRRRAAAKCSKIPACGPAKWHAAPSVTRTTSRRWWSILPVTPRRTSTARSFTSTAMASPSSSSRTRCAQSAPSNAGIPRSWRASFHKPWAPT
jgi:NAD(P)-dependent dehydrogenase (short-subunit alcohol dehydrogenase family)